jgi:hypothetical protein
MILGLPEFEYLRLKYRTVNWAIHVARIGDEKFTHNFSRKMCKDNMLWNKCE